MKLSERMRLPDEMFPEDFADEVAKLEARLEDEEGLKMQAVQEWNRVEAETAALKRALHELAQFDYRLGIDAMRKFAFDAIPADTQESER